MTQPTIFREDGPTRGRYTATVDGIDAEAELTYSRPSPMLLIAHHTGVPDALRGRGIGRLLTTRMVEDARAQGVKIVARCTFVDAERRKHPEWADIFQS